MIAQLKLRKSGGIPVTLRVHRILAKANDARDTGSPAHAAEQYRAALDLDPSLTHIWVQYGHMLRMIDQHSLAKVAYEESLQLNQASDPHLHLGHLHKELGNLPAAAKAYLAAARLDPSNSYAIFELHALMSKNMEITPEDMMTIIPLDDSADVESDHTVSGAAERARAAIMNLADTLREENSEGRQDLLESLEATSGLLETLEGPRRFSGSIGQSNAIVFDVSDLIAYFRDARLPTGIQRVQIETICSAFDAADAKPVIVCAFLESRDAWVKIPASMFRRLCRLSLESGDRASAEWLRATTKLQLTLAIADAFVFPDGAFLVNLGTSWWLQNYFLYVRQAKAEHNIHYVPFVHDLIPVMASEHCVKELTQDFISWAIGAFEHADFYLTNSEATKQDLLKIARYLGYAIYEDHIAVIRLDADFRKPVAVQAAPTALSRWGIGRSEFILFVSTVESRKNHLGAFDAWISLVRQHGSRNVPKLVCVGNRGWLNDAIYARLDTHEVLKDKVIMLSGLSDGELDLLYRSCLFTLYPSNYEGWGLPVTESLCYGKVPLISNASSLPEAGGLFAQYFEAGSTPRLIAALEQLLFVDGHRQAMERNIADNFRPRRWQDIAAQIAATTTQWAEAGQDLHDTAVQAPVARAGAYHPVTRSLETRIWPGMRSGEIFRAGTGWWGPDNWGCWTKAEGGRLEIGVPSEITNGVRLYIQLHGLPSRPCAWTLRLDDIGESLHGELRAQMFKWITLDIHDLPSDRVLRLLLTGESVVDLRTVTDNGDPRVVSVGLAGFFLCAMDDLASRSALLEAVAMGNLEDLAFNRERADTQRLPFPGALRRI